MIVVIDYGLGNLGSIANMLKKVKAEVLVSSRVDDIQKAEKLILPGVGPFDAGMKNLAGRGLIDLLNEKVVKGKTPILGLCLGMQLFTQKSEEGVLPGLGWIEAETVRFHFEDQTILKIPHMGWNFIKREQDNPIFTDFDEETRFYFVHAFHCICHHKENILAITNYGYDFPSMIVKGNIVGTQFHPEKSHKFGMRLFKNFVERF